MATDFKESLEYEAFIDRVLKLRQGEKRPWWQSVEAISVVASSTLAIATLIISPIAAYYSQVGTKRFETGLAREEQVVNREREAAAATAELLTLALKGTEDRFYMVRGAFNGYPRGLRDSISAAANAIDDRWRNESLRMDLLMQMYFGMDSAVIGQWRRAKTDVNSYAQCVELLTLQMAGRSAPPEACAAHQPVAIARFDSLRAALVSHFAKYHSLSGHESH
jgi:hypothetical protein